MAKLLNYDNASSAITFFIFFGCLSHVASLVDSESTHRYTLLTPKSVIAGEDLILTISLYESDVCLSCTLTFQASIRTPADERNLYDEFQKVNHMFASAGPPISEGQDTVTSGETLQFAMTTDSSWPAGEYELTVNSTTDGFFNVSTKFQVTSNDHTVIIETDKPVYKPSQTVKIRVVVFDTYLKPRNESLTITVKDADENNLRRWRNVFPNDGLAQFELPLSDRPPFGTWTVTAETDRIKKSVKVFISEYVLPTFKVDILMSATLPNEEIKYSVQARYTYGEPVYGSLEMSVSINKKSIKLPLIDNFNGNAEFELTQVQLDSLKAVHAVDEELKVQANLTEPLSGLSAQAEAVAKLTHNTYMLTYMELNSNTFKPGHTFTGYYQLTHPNETMLAVDITLNLSVNLDGTTGSKVIPVPKSGIIQISFDVPVEARRVDFLAKAVISDGMEVDSPPQFLTLFDVVNAENSLSVKRADSSVVYANDTVSLVVASSQTSLKASYIVIARNRVQATGTVDSSDGLFNVTMTTECSPRTSILVYANINGELLADIVHFNVLGAFRNQLSVALIPMYQSQKIEPGSEVLLQVETNPGSLVGVTSVDSAVLLLSGPNDITSSKVLSELRDLTKPLAGCTGTESGQPTFNLPLEFLYPAYGSNDNSGDVISQAGFTVKTTLSLEQCTTIFGLGIFNHLNKKSETHIRKKFPETWLWELQRVNDSLSVTPIIVPDTITTWVTTAVSMHPDFGLAVTRQPHQFVVIKPFFVVVTLPYSMVQGEELEVRVTMYNYDEKDSKCTLTVDQRLDDNAAESGFMLKRKEVDTYSFDPVKFESQSISAGQGIVSTLWIKPSTAGSKTMTLNAGCDSGFSDVVEKQLLVKSPGVSQDFCWSNFLFSSESEDSYKKLIGISYPHNVVPGSKHLEVIATGNVMGQILDSLDHLIKLPYGCGEQNMIVLAPSVFVRQYMEAMDNLDSATIYKTTSYMLKGYQRQLSYMHKDGSFSAFGPRAETSGSTWLTAFVLKILQQAQPYTDGSIDDKILLKSKDYLLGQRREKDGAFLEPGVVVHTEMQGGSFTSRSTLTAYIVIALIESAENRTQMVQELAMSINYLERVRSSVKYNPYKISIISYALALSGISSKLDDYLDRLMHFSKTTADGDIYWSNSSYAVPDRDIEGYRAPVVGTTDIEMTSYALLAYLAKGDLTTSRKIAKWIISQRNAQGGFSSTQDTVLALQALTIFGSRVIPDDMSLRVKFIASGGNVQRSEPSYQITKPVYLLTYKSALENAEDIDSVTVDVEGYGTVLLSICVSYNIADMPAKVLPTTEKPSTVKSPTTLIPSSADNSSIPETSADESQQNYVTVNVTTKAAANDVTNVNACARSTENSTGMAIISVAMPSGHEPIMKSVSSAAPTHKLTELSTDNTVHAYFDNFSPGDDTCLNVPIKPTVNMKNVKEATVKAYDYYQADKGSVISYSVGDDNIKKKSQTVSSTGYHINVSGMTLTAVLLAMCLLTG